MPDWGLVVLTGFFTLLGTIIGGLFQFLVRKAEIKSELLLKSKEITGQLTRDATNTTLKIMEQSAGFTEEQQKKLIGSFSDIHKAVVGTGKGKTSTPEK